MDVKFKFNIKDKVRTIFGALGIIDMLAIDSGENETYFVKTQTNSQWFDVDQLEEANDKNDPNQKREI
jgi:hypothetical protein